MENLFLIILLIVGIVILAIPQSVSKTIKKAMPVLLLFLAVFGIGFFINNQTNNEIQIIASNTQDEKAEGNEIFLKEVIVNGESKKPGEVFSQGWIEKDDGLLWRSYDQIEGMKDSIHADFQNGDDVVLVLKQNKWQGKARIISVQGDQEFNGYVDSESDNWMNFEVKVSTASFLSRKNLLPIAVVVWIFLVGVSLVCKRFFPEQKKENKERLIGLDILKIVSALMIILIHSSANIYNNHEVGTSIWFAGLVLNVIPRFAVPTFLMISGALLLGRKTDLNKIIKRAITAGIVLFAWSFAYIVMKKIAWGEGDILKETVMLLFRRGPSGHLWYGYLLVWVYLFVPILNRIYESLTIKMRVYFIVIALIVPSIIDGIINYLSLEGQILESPYFMYMHLGYISIIFIGRLVYENREKISVFLGVASFAIGFLITMILTSVISKKMGTSVDVVFSELEISNILYAFGVMILVCKLSWRGDSTFVKKMIIRLSELSLGVYFSHSLLMWAIGENISIGNLHFNIGNSVPECLLFVCIIFIGTIIAIAPLANIPFLKKLVKVS